MEPRHPTLGAISVAFAAGILAADHAGPFAHAPLVWLSASLLLPFALAGLRHVPAVGRRSRRARAAILAIAFLLGGARLACTDRTPPTLPAASAADDRDPDDLAGTITGPIEDLPAGRRFTLALDPPATARIQITARGTPRPELLPGDHIALAAKLRTGRGYRTPGALAMDRVLAARGVDLVATVDADAIDRKRSTWSPWRWPTAAQRTLAAGVAERGGDRRGNAVVRGMVLGDLSGLDDRLQEDFRDAGVVHVLSISGLHLAVVALLSFALLRRLWATIPPLALRLEPATAAALLAAPAAVAYTLLSGAHVATLRALLVVLVVLGGHALTRRARLTDALGAAALLILLHAPAQLWDASFQLSFAATATLALVMVRRDPADMVISVTDPPAAPFARLQAGLLRRARALLHATFWATLATAPLTALHFGSVPLGGFVANLAVVPLGELLVLPVGLIGSLLAAASPAAGGLLIDAAVALAGLTCVIASAVASVAPVARIPPPTPFELLAWFALWLAAVATARRRFTRRARIALFSAAILSLAASHLWHTELAPRLRTDLAVHFLDVGQGDAAVLELPGGEVWLIDGGGLPFVIDAADESERARRAAAPGERSVLRFLAHRRIDRIDVLVITHPHPDHYAGLAALPGRIDIGQVWVARGADHADEIEIGPAYQALIAALTRHGARIVHPPIGQPLAAGAAQVTVLAPDWAGDATATADDLTDANDDSIVLRLDFAGRRLLFTGDAELEEEQDLLARAAAELRADLIKVPHHGSRTSSTPDLVAAVAPTWAVISCGAGNRFGLPNDDVVDRWRAAGARILRTDRDGTITATITAGGDLRVTTFE